MQGQIILPFGIRKKNSPLVLWLHSATGSPVDLRSEAEVISVLFGAVVILPLAPYATSRLEGKQRGFQDVDLELKLWNQTSIELSRWLDHAEENLGCDLSRSVAIGMNLGGSQIAHWLTRDKRMQYAVISGAVTELSTFWLNSDHLVAKRAREFPLPAIENYARRTRKYDLVNSVEKLGTRDLFFQFGGRDDWLDRNGIEKLNWNLEWIDDDHDMVSIESHRSRVRALERFLGEKKEAMCFASRITNNE